jgi:hypothetical protein
LTIAIAALGVVPTWSADWAWGLPIIVATLVIHVFGLLLINETAERLQNGVVAAYSYPVIFAVIIGGAGLSAALLHGVDAIIWAGAYRLVGALPDNSSAVLYSLSALTAYGHANLDLERHWQVMGALEALNGMLLFGLTTGCLFGIIQRVWELRRSRSH